MKVYLSALVLFGIFFINVGCVENRLSPLKDPRESFASVPEIRFGSLAPEHLVKCQTDTRKSNTIAGLSPSVFSRYDIQSASDVGFNAQPDIKVHSVEQKLNLASQIPESPPQTSSRRSAAPLESENDQKSSNGKVVIKPTLRPQAEPFVPHTHVRHLLLGKATGDGSRQNVLWRSPPVLNSMPIEHRIAVDKAHRYLASENLWNYANEHLQLFPKVIAGFEKAKELEIWFLRLSMAGKRQAEPWSAEYPLKKAMKRISPFEPHAHSRFHPPHAIDGNLEFATPFQNAYLFGRDAGNSYTITSMTPRLTCATLVRRLELFKGSLLRPDIRDDQVHMLFFWPIIIAGAKQWYFEEEATFHGYMSLLTPLHYKHEPRNDMTDAKEDEKIRFEYLFKTQQRGMKAFAHILAAQNQKGIAYRWMNHNSKILAQKNYYPLNSQIEDTIFQVFKNDISHSRTNHVQISNFKINLLSNKWGIHRSNLVTLIWRCTKSQASRGVHTMGPQLSEVSLRYFSDKLVHLAKELVLVQNTKKKSGKTKATSELLSKLYAKVIDDEK